MTWPTNGRGHPAFILGRDVRLDYLQQLGEYLRAGIVTR